MATTGKPIECCAGLTQGPPPGQEWMARGRVHTGALPAFPTKKARLEFFRAGLAARPAWAYRALVLIFQQQTAEEQAAGATILLNGRGFSGVDAPMLGSLAAQYLAKKAAFPGSRVWLSSRQEAVIRRRVPKYAGQLIALLEVRGVLPSLRCPLRRSA